MKKNTGKVREICPSEKVGSMGSVMCVQCNLIPRVT